MGMLGVSFILSSDAKKDRTSRQAALREERHPDTQESYYKFVFSILEYNNFVAAIFFHFYPITLFFSNYNGIIQCNMPLAYPLLYSLTDQ
jgi:hypothetical protein